VGYRDGYCTPRWITRRLPWVDLDPASNPRSTVKARRSCMLERGENGLLVSWRGLSIFCNPPFSDVAPFAEKASEAESFCFLVNVDVSTRWRRRLTMFPSFTFPFYSRIEFEAPEGIETSRNDSPQEFICDPAFRERIGDAFKGYGEWWKNF